MFNLKELRTSKGMTQYELAEKAKVNRGIIVRLESGKDFSTTTATLRKLADALEVPISALFYSSDA